MKFHSHPYKVGRISPVPGQAKHSLSSEMTWQWLAARTQESPASHNQPGQRLKMIRRTKRKTLPLCMCVSSRINTGPNVTSACVLSTGKCHLGSNSLVAMLLGLLHCKQWDFSKVEKVEKRSQGKQATRSGDVTSYSVALLSFTVMPPPAWYLGEGFHGRGSTPVPMTLYQS